MTAINPLSSNNLALEPIVSLALEEVRQYLRTFAARPEFFSQMRSLFGESFSDEAALNLAQAWQTGDFSIIGAIQFLSSSELNGANGAYASATDTIYLSREFVQKQDVSAIASLLLEEIGHRIDRLLNSEDSAGDEGAIFSALVRGESLSEAELAQLKAEDDRGTISLNRQAIAVEQQNFTGDGNNNNISGTAEDDVIDGLGGNDTLSGLDGNDSLIGGTGNDSLIGGAGNDTLDGSTGTNTLDGGDGDDVLTPATGTSVDDNSTVDGGTGNDLLIADFTSANFYGISSSGLGLYNDSQGFKGRYDGRSLLTVSNVELFNIIGTPYNDELYVKEGDNFDGNNGTDILKLDLANATTSVNFNLSQADNQLTYGNTIVKNFEDVKNLTTGSGDDVINLGNTSTVDNEGIIDTGEGKDTLIVDFTSANFYGINSSGLGLYNDSQGFKGRYDGRSLLTVSNVELFNIIGTPYNDELYVKEGDNFDGNNGTDILKLDLANATTSVNFNLSQADNQLTYGNTIVKNFEDVKNLTTGSGDDVINLGNTSTVDNEGIIDTGEGKDTLIVDFTSANFYGISSSGLGLYNDSQGFKGRYDGRSLLTVSNVEIFNLIGTPYNDNLQGFANNDTLDGNSGNDSINGGDGNDNVIGGAGNDTVNGGAGNDLIIGVNPYSNTPGINEVDNLAGGVGGDTFVLGNNTTVFYDDNNITNAGTGNYALITDFNLNEDKIQLQGAKSNYSLTVSGSNTSIYLNKPSGEPAELIAIIQGVTGLDINASYTIISEDPPQPGAIAFSNSQFSVNEDGTPVVAVTVIRTGGSDGEVSVTLTPSNGTATEPSDYTNTPITVTFANGETSKTVTIPINNDPVYEPTETVNLTLSAPTNGATLGTQTTAVLNIIDNDAVAGVLSFSNASYNINENGTPVTQVTINRTGGSRVSAYKFVAEYTEYLTKRCRENQI
jgi:Ca2+-binding RTX toxin-like protein